VYAVPANKYIRDGAESIIQARPTLDSTARWANTKLNYLPKELLPAWQLLIQASPELNKSDGYGFDVVDVTRQVLANYALTVHQKLVIAYLEKNRLDFKKYSNQFIVLIQDMDRLLATRKDFLLGKWIADARRCGSSLQEKALYEQNAKNLITLWGDKNCPLNEYACKQWSGLFYYFYKTRWEQFLAELTKDLDGEKAFNSKNFKTNIRSWERKWLNKRENFT
jgi:alpha-N-acetylglucosaminidase